MTKAVVRVELAWHRRPDLAARAVPEALRGPSRMGAEPPHPSPPYPSPGGPGPSRLIPSLAWCQHQGQQATALRTAIWGFGPDFPDQAPCQAPWEAWSNASPTAPAIPQHRQVRTPRYSWPAPQRWLLWKVSGQDTPPTGAEVEDHFEIGTDGPHTPCGWSANLVVLIPAEPRPEQGLHAPLNLLNEPTD